MIDRYGFKLPRVYDSAETTLVVVTGSKGQGKTVMLAVLAWHITQNWQRLGIRDPEWSPALRRQYALLFLAFDPTEESLALVEGDPEWFGFLYRGRRVLILNMPGEDLIQENRLDARPELPARR
jgi:hypothetical protein